MGHLEQAIQKYRLIPTDIIEPPENLYETLDFDSALIAKAMQMGRDYVEEHWPRLERFLAG